MPNPWRKKANGRPVYCVQLRIWQDDVSGNVSKQWNKHWLFCMTHAGLPRQLLTQEYFTKFICCSPYASVTEQAAAIRYALEYVYLVILQSTGNDIGGFRNTFPPLRDIVPAMMGTLHMIAQVIRK